MIASPDDRWRVVQAGRAFTAVINGSGAANRVDRARTICANFQSKHLTNQL